MNRNAHLPSGTALRRLQKDTNEHPNDTDGTRVENGTVQNVAKDMTQK